MMNPPSGPARTEARHAEQEAREAGPDVVVAIFGRLSGNAQNIAVLSVVYERVHHLVQDVELLLAS